MYTLQSGKLIMLWSNFDANDGGHGMIFKTIEGKIYLSIHSPNTKSEKNPTFAIFVPVREEGDRLVCDFD